MHLCPLESLPKLPNLKLAVIGHVEWVTFLKVTHLPSPGIISSGEEYGYSYNYFMTICGKNPNTKKPEYTMIKVISGNDAFYIIQKAWRYEPTNSQIQDWSKLVSKVFLCDSRNKNAPCPKI